MGLVLRCSCWAKSVLLLEETDVVVELLFWDWAWVTVICSEGTGQFCGSGAVGADTAVDLGRVPVCWKAEGVL